MALHPGAPGVAETIGEYTLLAELGRGKEAVVYAAHASATGSRVALKVWDASLSARPEIVARVRRVVEQIQAINHPNLVRIHELAIIDGLMVAVMEHMDESLDAKLTPGSAFAVSDALDIAADVAAGLAALHEAEIVHGDVKPSNILRVKDTVKLGDFGAARDIHTDSPGGTLAYASPEQCLGLPCDGRSDLYSLGVVLYEMLAGERPFASIEQLMRREAIPLARRRPDLAQGILALVDRMLAESPDERIASAGELAGLLSGTALSERLSAPACSPGIPYRPADGEAIHRLPPARVPEDPRVRLYQPIFFSLGRRENLGGYVTSPGAWRRLQVIRVSTPHGDVHVTAENAHVARASVVAGTFHPAGRLVFYPDSAAEVTIPYYPGVTYQLGSDPYTHSDMASEWYVVIDALELPGLIGLITGNATVEYLWHGRDREIRERALVPGQTMDFANLVPLRFEPQTGS
jgi:hypothetical protein